MLSQARLIEDITEGVVYGDCRGYQVQVATIGKATGLHFGDLVIADPLENWPLREAVPGIPPVILLDRLENTLL